MFDFKQAEELGGSFNPMFEFKKKGDKITGLLVGNKHDVGKHKSEVWTIKTEEDGDIDVWGCTVLDRELENLVLHLNAVEITYTGDGEAKGGGNPPHLFMVRVVGTDEEGKQISNSAICKEVEKKEEVKVKEDATTTTEED